MDNLLGLTAPAPLSLTTLAVNLVLSIALSTVLAWFYTQYGRSLSNRAHFAQTLPLMAMTTVLIISVVKSSLALSLGLVGALSIVRFRTPIKEPEELAYLFMAIAMGLGLGADQLVPTVVASAIILAVIGLLRRSRQGKEPRNLYLSLEWPTADSSEQPIRQLQSVIARHVTAGDLRRVDKRDGALEVTYFVDVPHTDNVSAMVEDLERSFPGMGVTFIDQNRMPSI